VPRVPLEKAIGPRQEWRAARRCVATDAAKDVVDGYCSPRDGIERPAVPPSRRRSRVAAVPVRRHLRRRVPLRTGVPPRYPPLRLRWRPAPAHWPLPVRCRQRRRHCRRARYPPFGAAAVVHGAADLRAATPATAPAVPRPLPAARRGPAARQRATRVPPAPPLGGSGMAAVPPLTAVESVNQQPQPASVAGREETQPQGSSRVAIIDFAPSRWGTRHRTINERSEGPHISQTPARTMAQPK
jgi:hypothetical protein